MLVNGIHHVCIKCRMDQVKKVKEFYTEVLGLPVLRSWGEPELAGFVFDSGAGLFVPAKKKRYSQKKRF